MLIEHLKTLLRRLHPELSAKTHLPRIGVIVSVTEPPDSPALADAFRPRYAVDVQLLKADGSEDEEVGILEALPLPAYMCGDESGLYGFPEPGTKVRIGFDYGLYSQAHVQAVLTDGITVPALQPGEQIWRHSATTYQRASRQGWERVTSGEISDNSTARNIQAVECEENFFERKTTVEANSTENIVGSKKLETGGAINISSGAGLKISSVNQLDVTTLGTLQLTAGGQLILSAVNATAQPQSIVLTTAIGTEISIDLTGLITLKTPALNLKTWLEQLLDHITKITVPTGTGPSGYPINTPLLLALKAQLKLLLK